MRKPVFFLEEDQDDWSLVKDTLAELGLEVPIRFFSDSTQFFQILETEPSPSLLMVDYNALPENGLQVLQRIKSHPNWTSLPVVILSDSSSEVLRDECYRYGASSFIKKPDTHAGTRDKIATFFKYWFNVVEV